MRNRFMQAGWARLAAVAGGLVAVGGCGTNDVTIPDLDGPSEFALSIHMTAHPDIVLANGYATSVIHAVLRDQNGVPIGGREVLFTVTDDFGRNADIGNFIAPRSLSDLGTSVSVATNNQGIAQVVYEAPPRTDATFNTSVTISARPIGTDFNGQIYRNVRIELRSPEPRLFPVIPGNVAPTCNFAVQAPQQFVPGATLLFQSTSFDGDGHIVRYEWYFTDPLGSTSYLDSHPDTAYVVRGSGDLTVLHVVTDNGGLQKACSVTIPIA